MRRKHFKIRHPYRTIGTHVHHESEVHSSDCSSTIQCAASTIYIAPPFNQNDQWVPRANLCIFFRCCCCCFWKFCAVKRAVEQQYILLFLLLFFAFQNQSQTICADSVWSLLHNLLELVSNFFLHSTQARGHFTRTHTHTPTKTTKMYSSETICVTFEHSLYRYLRIRVSITR